MIFRIGRSKVKVAEDGAEPHEKRRVEETKGWPVRAGLSLDF